MTTWTNKSVVAFATGDDPITKIQESARKWVLQAIEFGWQGPPFNPSQIANLMGAVVEPNYDISDARTVARDQKPVIEYNPSQPRERARFSIAHEVAHLLFDDALDEHRHRGGTGIDVDEWQLEMLCNLAAAEFVLPIGSFGDQPQLQSIEEMMIASREYDVSAEAFLIRMVKTSDVPLGAFCASPTSDKDGNSIYSVDYFVTSPVAPTPRIVGSRIPSESSAYHCTAIGYTDVGVEDWITEESVKVEYVGIPPYPGVTLPRVLGLVRFGHRQTGHHPIRYVHGNILEPRGDGNRFVCQLVNDRALKWGGGVARQAANKYPEAQADFAKSVSKIPPEDRLGFVHFSQCDEGITICSIVGQAGFGKSAKPRIRYAAIEVGFQRVAEQALLDEATVHMPRIGAGAAGGKWPAIKDLIEDRITREGVEVIIYDLPPKRKQLQLF